MGEKMNLGWSRKLGVIPERKESLAYGSTWMNSEDPSVNKLITKEEQLYDPTSVRSPEESASQRQTVEWRESGVGGGWVQRAAICHLQTVSVRDEKNILEIGSEGTAETDLILPER